MTLEWKWPFDYKSDALVDARIKTSSIYSQSSLLAKQLIVGKMQMVHAVIIKMQMILVVQKIIKERGINNNI